MIDRFSNFHFLVVWEGSSVGGFSQVSGLSNYLHKKKYRAYGRPKNSLDKIPGFPRFSNINLKRGLIGDNDEFNDWLKSTNQNKKEQHNLVIILLNENKEHVMCWKVVNAFPVKVEGLNLETEDNGMAIEEIELAFEEIVIAKDRR